MPGWLLTRIMKLPSAPRLITTGWPGRGPSASGLLSVWRQMPPSCEPRRPIGRGRSGWRRGDHAFERGDLVFLLLLVVAAAEDREARQRQAEQPAPALADLGAVDDDDLAPLGRLLERGGGGVEALQPRRVLGDRAAAHQRLERSGRCCGARRRWAARPRPAAPASRAASKKGACESLHGRSPISMRRDIAGAARDCASLCAPACARAATVAILPRTVKMGAIQERELLQFRFIP